jgi:hypothetical protein
MPKSSTMKLTYGKIEKNAIASHVCIMQSTTNARIGNGVAAAFG